MNSVRINKGKQNPNIFTKLHTYLQSYSKSIQVMFTEDSDYRLPAGEQADWNKLIGRKAFIRTNGSLNPFNWEFGGLSNFGSGGITKGNIKSHNTFEKMMTFIGRLRNLHVKAGGIL